MSNSGFPKQWLARPAVDLRDRLLKVTIPQLLGVPLECSVEDAQAARYARVTQLKAHSDADGPSPAGRAAVQDLINIITTCCDVLTIPERAKEYSARTAEAGRDLPFDKFIRDFELTPIKARPKADAPLPPIGSQNPQQRPPQRPPPKRPAQKRPPQSGMDPAQIKRKRPPGGGQQPNAGHFPPGGEPKIQNQTPPTAEPVQKKPKSKEQSPPTPPKKLSKEQREKQERQRQFGGAHNKPKEGDPFDGPLIFGVGQAGRGLKHVIVAYGMAFSCINIPVSALELGRDELSLSANEPMIYVRTLVLLAAGLVGFIALRKESPARVGVKPAHKITAAAAIPIAIGLGLAISAIAQFPLTADTNIGVAVGLLAIRALGEGFFFHGFITRTLLIEMHSRVLAVLCSAILYGFYAMTYAGISGETASWSNAFVCMLIYGLGSAVPLAVLYWKTRSFLVVVMAQFVILATVAIVSFMTL